MASEVSQGRVEVGEIFRACGAKYRAAHAGRLALRHLRTLRAIEICRTAALGGHLCKCDQCGHERPEYNSCRNRHCPKCQHTAKRKWLSAREAEILPVEYFHVVFTIPHEFEPIVIRNQRAMYEILFRAASETLIEIAEDEKHLGARIGILAILHTWGQTLVEHTHLHCVVPGGGAACGGDEERWVASRRGFFLPVRVLSKLFRGKFLAFIEASREKGEIKFPGKIEPLGDPTEFGRLIASLRVKSWVVYAKRPFAGPKQVLGYLANYTHRVAISNARIAAFDGERVTFRYRDYAYGSETKTMTLSAEEFIRRFLLHVLPERFTRIRYFGFLANRGRREKIARCRALIAATGAERSARAGATEEELREEVPEEGRKEGSEEPSASRARGQCPTCGSGTMRRVAEIEARRWRSDRRLQPWRPP